MVKINVDSKGLSCPGPLTEFVKAYRTASNGDEIELTATDPAAGPDMKSWCEATGNIFEGVKEENNVYVILIKVTAKKF